MYKACKTEQSAIRQRELEQGLLEEMSIRHYDEISVSDLCKRMQIPRKSFYRYFSGKDGALHALLDHTLLEYERLSFMMDVDGNTDYHQLVNFFLFWKERAVLLDALERSNMSGLLIEAAVAHALRDSSISGHFNSESVVGEYSTMFAVCGLMSMILRWHTEKFAMSETKMAKIAVQILTKPLQER